VLQNNDASGEHYGLQWLRSFADIYSPSLRPIESSSLSNVPVFSTIALKASLDDDEMATIIDAIEDIDDACKTATSILNDILLFDKMKGKPSFHVTTDCFNLFYLSAN
jgi:hypothetical protein